MTNILHETFLTDSAAPYLQVLPGRQAIMSSDRAQRLGFTVFNFDGRELKDDRAIFEEFFRVMRFPNYFGRNWSAMDDCLRDMGWVKAPGYLLIVSNAEALFQMSPSSAKSLVECLRFVGDHWHSWQTQNVPFKTIFVANEKRLKKDWLEIAKPEGHGKSSLDSSGHN